MNLEQVLPIVRRGEATAKLEIILGGVTVIMTLRKDADRLNFCYEYALGNEMAALMFNSDAWTLEYPAVDFVTAAKKVLSGEWKNAVNLEVMMVRVNNTIYFRDSFIDRNLRLEDLDAQWREWRQNETDKH